VIAPTGFNTNQINSNLPSISDIYIGTLTVPIMMTLPNINSGQAMPSAGWPIIMYQHGITRNRTDIVAYADGLAQAGFTVIAIDLPTHGLTDESNPSHATNTLFANTEQTFGVIQELKTQLLELQQQR